MQFNPNVNPDAAEILRKLFVLKNTLVKSNKAFSKDEFLSGLKQVGLPSNGHFWMTILNFVLPTLQCKLLTKVRKDGYVFTKPKEPIHYSDLQALYDTYSKTIKRYQQTYREKKQQQSAVRNEGKEKPKDYFEELKEYGEKSKEARDEQSIQIREAIDLLKSHGFEVLAPVTMLYAKM